MDVFCTFSIEENMDCQSNNSYSQNKENLAGSDHQNQKALPKTDKTPSQDQTSQFGHPKAPVFKFKQDHRKTEMFVASKPFQEWPSCQTKQNQPDESGLTQMAAKVDILDLDWLKENNPLP